MTYGPNSPPGYGGAGPPPHAPWPPQHAPFAPGPPAYPPGGPRGPNRGSRAPWGWGLVGGAALVMLCGAGIVYGALTSARDERAFGPLRAACEGRPVPGARALVPGAAPGSHRIATFRHASDGHWVVGGWLVPEGERADGVADADLVLCAEEQARLPLDTCTYTFRPARGAPRQRATQRTQTQLAIRVVAAATGAVVASGVLSGAAPPACEAGGVAPRSASDYDGRDVGAEEVGAFLRSNGL